MTATPRGRRASGWVDALLHLHDTPTRTAAAFAMGVFFSFSPFFGLQVVTSFTLAFLLRLNRVAVFAGLNTNLPWFLVPWYGLTTVAAAAVLGTELPGDMGERLKALASGSVLTRDFWEQAVRLMSPLAAPFVIGSTVGAALLATVAYHVTRALLTRRASRHPPGEIG